MVSDVVCEHLVEKKREKSEKIKSALIIAGAVLIVLVCAVVFTYFPSLGAILMLVMIGTVYGAILLLKGLAVEYEYCFVNGELTVDKITNKSARKNLVVLEVKNVDKAGYYDSKSFNENEAGMVLSYSDSDKPTDAVYLRFRNTNGYTTTLILSLKEDFIVKMKPHFNQLVYREAFKK